MRAVVGRVMCDALSTLETNSTRPGGALVARQSINSDWEAEAARFKWIESEKAGFDLGEMAIRQWVKDHWTGYLRAKWVEHLQGKCFWIELDRGDFGLLQTQFQDQRHLLEPIVEKIKAGQENLNIILWAKSGQFSDETVEAVMQILEALDINSRRLANRFETP
jgi:hypothetical protein